MLLVESLPADLIEKLWRDRPADESALYQTLYEVPEIVGFSNASNSEQTRIRSTSTRSGHR